MVGFAKQNSRRIVLGCVILAIAATGSFMLLRATSLHGLPDIGDPFDVAHYGMVEIPTNQNAYTYYVRAHEQLDQNYPKEIESVYTDWTKVTDSERSYLEKNRKALMIWLEGTKRDRGIYCQPGAITFETLLPADDSLRMFCRLGNLEACRLEHKNDTTNAWIWLRANLRASRHCGKDGTIIERLAGIAIYAATSKQVMSWANNPKVDAKQLRYALEDVLAINEMTPDDAESLRLEYFGMMNSLSDPIIRNHSYSQPDSSLKSSFAATIKYRVGTTLGVLIHEPERSRRVVRLVMANWLAAANLPASERAKRLTQSGTLFLYLPNQGEEPLFSLKDLERWFDSTVYAKEFLCAISNFDRALSRDEQCRAALIIHLAEQLYIREHGKPPGSVDELVGPYLKSLPGGYTPSGESTSPGTSR